MHEHDTICAISTPPGEGGIGIIRVSGPDAVRIASGMFRMRSGKMLDAAASHTIHYGAVVMAHTGLIVDEALVSIMRAPATYTREDVVEINCHGGMVPLRKTMELLLAAGARQAYPGEFTKRAFLSGRIDLAQAESVMDIIHAKTERSHRAANELLTGRLSTEVGKLRDTMIALLASVEASIDFSEEELEAAENNSVAAELTIMRDNIDGILAGGAYGRIMRDGCSLAIVGRPNVGKSSLLNALLMQDRAIVTDIPGTTRDVLEEALNIDGFLFRILDTAGIRHSQDPVEREGVRRSLAAIDSADIVLMVIDGSSAVTAEDLRVLDKIKDKDIIIAVNKDDLPRKAELVALPGAHVNLSCITGTGLERLRTVLAEKLANRIYGRREHVWSVNQRHKSALEQARSALQKAGESVQSGLSPEFIALDMRDALDHLGKIVGATYTEDILEKIFRDFCIGK